MPVAGSIAEFARGILPYTWDALSREPQFGDALLQRNVNLVKEGVFGTVIPVPSEDAFPLRVLKYCAKLVAIEIISSGIDMWMNQPQQESATGTNEVHSFEARSEVLRKLRETLLAEVLRDESDILALVGVPRLRSRARMGITTADDDLLLTPDPRGFPLPYRQDRG